MNSLTYSSINCSICLENYVEDQSNTCLLLKCRHIFHEACVTPWLKNHTSCPLCKSRAIVSISLKETLKIAYEEVKHGIKKLLRTTIYTALVFILIIHVPFVSNFLFKKKFAIPLKEPAVWLILSLILFVVPAITAIFRGTVRNTIWNTVRIKNRLAEKLDYRPHTD